MKTRDVNTRIVIVLGLVFCMALFQIAASAEAVETTSEIFVPNGGVTIVLRAPTSGNPQIIKISKDRNGNYKQEVIQSLGVYLPKKTPVFFSVDQVNTALYDVNITVEELKGENTEEQNVLLLPQFAEMLSFLEKTIGKLQSGTASISGSENNLLETPDSGLQAVKKKLQAVKDLNSELDELLYMSEKPGFSGFKSIKSDAIDAVKELGLDNGTSEEFCAKAEEIINELPLMFGFSVYTSIDWADENGEIPFPSAGEFLASGHAVVAVGYDDSLEIEHPLSRETTTGALLIRNSWGTTWGEAGYGWLPYDYVLWGLTSDWWVLLRQEWVNFLERSA